MEIQLAANDGRETPEEDGGLIAVRDLLNGRLESANGNASIYGLVLEHVSADTYDDQPEAFFRCRLDCLEPADELRFFVKPDFSCLRVEYWIWEPTLGMYCVRHIRDDEWAASIWSCVSAHFVQLQ